MTTPTDSLPSIVRPNGKLYRPRKLRVEEWNVRWQGQFSVLVLGTHDIDQALPLARQRAFEYDVEDIRLVETGWWHDSIRNHDRYWTPDDVRGAAGVLFEEVISR
jgi:hypothetical protein